MKKREFLKRLLGVTAAAVVAPKVLLAEEEPTKVDKREIIYGVCVEEVISCGDGSAEVFCNSTFLRLRDLIEVRRDGKTVGLFSMVIGFSKMPGEKMYRVRLRSVQSQYLDVKKGDFLAVKSNAYAEK